MQTFHLLNETWNKLYRAPLPAIKLTESFEREASDKPLSLPSGERLICSNHSSCNGPHYSFLDSAVRSLALSATAGQPPPVQLFFLHAVLLDGLTCPSSHQIVHCVLFLSLVYHKSLSVIISRLTSRSASRWPTSPSWPRVSPVLFNWVTVQSLLLAPSSTSARSPRCQEPATQSFVGCPRGSTWPSLVGFFQGPLPMGASLSLIQLKEK